MEDFIIGLEKDRFLRKDGRKSSEETKVDLKKAIKKFYKWLLGENEHYPEIVDWIDTSTEVKEVPALTREEIERLVNQTGSMRNKAIIMVLFDSGARIEELLNIIETLN